MLPAILNPICEIYLGSEEWSQIVSMSTFRISLRSSFASFNFISFENFLLVILILLGDFFSSLFHSFFWFWQTQVTSFSKVLWTAPPICFFLTENKVSSIGLSLTGRFLCFFLPAQWFLCVCHCQEKPSLPNFLLPTCMAKIWKVFLCFFFCQHSGSFFCHRQEKPSLPNFLLPTCMAKISLFSAIFENFSVTKEQLEAKNSPKTLRHKETSFEVSPTKGQTVGKQEKGLPGNRNVLLKGFQRTKRVRSFCFFQ